MKPTAQGAAEGSKADGWACEVGVAGIAGVVSGPLTVYFHGAPGAPQELAVFNASACACGLTLKCFDRFALDAALTGPTYFEALAGAVRSAAGTRQVHVIGFSIGGCIALQVCRLLGPQVGQLHLVSAAAPLQSGHFLPHMAGRALFQAAAASPSLFKAMACGQAALARWRPGALRRVLFRRAAGEDRVLAADPAFRASMNDLLRSCLFERRAGYVRDILAYVQDWSATLPQVSADTTIWHGSVDNWSPMSMALGMQASLPNCQRAHRLEGLSHYSCLHAAAPRICEKLATARR
jgi:pimeloyl-ACP methyl ester carboxylesterase